MLLLLVRSKPRSGQIVGHQRLPLIASSTMRRSVFAGFSPLLRASFSTPFLSASGNRNAITGSTPVAGLPRPRFFPFTEIDLAINSVYKKSRPKARRRPRLRPLTFEPLMWRDSMAQDNVMRPFAIEISSGDSPLRRIITSPLARAASGDSKSRSSPAAVRGWPDCGP
jgi:hypothetical protein